MENLFVPYEIALKLKEKGFKGTVMNNMYYHVHYKTLHDYSYFNHFDNMLDAPIYQEVVDWFRNKHNIAILIEIGTQEFSYKLFNLSVDRPLSGTEAMVFNGNYYEALREAIERAIRYIK